MCVPARGLPCHSLCLQHDDHQRVVVIARWIVAHRKTEATLMGTNEYAGSCERKALDMCAGKRSSGGVSVGWRASQALHTALHKL